MAEALERCGDCFRLLVSPAVQSTFEDLAPQYGPGVAGLLFGAGWWFFVDAIIYTSHVHGAALPGILCLPGIIASIALIMINIIRREDISGSNVYGDEGTLCRSKFWLFLSYCVSFAAVISAVGLLIEENSKGDSAHVWPTIAALCQVCFILGSALTFFLSRAPSEDSYSFY